MAFDVAAGTVGPKAGVRPSHFPYRCSESEKWLGLTPGAWFRQGLRWYELLPNMPEDRLKKRMNEFVAVMREHEVCSAVLGVL